MSFFDNLTRSLVVRVSFQMTFLLKILIFLERYQLIIFDNSFHKLICIYLLYIFQQGAFRINGRNNALKLNCGWLSVLIAFKTQLPDFGGACVCVYMFIQTYIFIARVKGRKYENLPSLWSCCSPSSSLCTVRIWGTRAHRPSVFFQATWVETQIVVSHVRVCAQDLTVLWGLPPKIFFILVSK